MTARRLAAATLAALLLAALLPLDVLANEPPVAVDDPSLACGNGAFNGSFPVVEDDAFGPQPANTDCGLGANDSDPDGDPLTYELVDQATHGTAVVASDGAWSYTPDPDFATPVLDAPSDSFTYRVSDGTVFSAPATMRLWVAPVNDAPTFTPGADVEVDEDSGAYSQSWATDVSPGPANEADQTVSFIVDVDADHQAMFSVQPAIDATGSLTFTTAPDFFGTATVTAKLHDDGGLEDWGVPHVAHPKDTSDPVTFSITLDAVADQPMAAEDTLTILEDAPTTDVDVLANDTSPDTTGVLTVTGVGTASKGVAALRGDALAATYTPTADAFGSDSFTYDVSDGTLGDTGTVDVTIVPVNDAPSFSAGADQAIVDVAGPQTVTGWATGLGDGPGETGQALTFHVTGNSDPSLFTVGPAIAADGTLTFDPAAGHTGTATISIDLSDDGGTANGGVDTSPTQTFTITVGPNHAPNAANDLVTVSALSSGAALNVRGNDSAGAGDLGDTTTISAATNGAKGTVTITGGGTGLTYDPTGCATGTDTFTYTLRDAGGLTDTATVLVTIKAPTTVPAADIPAAAFVTGGTISSKASVRISWCGLTSGTTIRGYTLGQSTSGGSFATLLSGTTATSTTRSLATSPTTYRYRVRATDNKGRTGAYRYGPTFRLRRFEDTSSSLTYVGSWSTATTTSASGGAMHYTYTAGRAVRLTTSAFAFAIVGPRSTSRGSFDVYLDGAKVTPTAISEKASTVTYKRVLYARTMPGGTHTIEVRAVGDGRIDLDAILVLTTP